MLVVLLAVAATSACQWLRPYRVDIRQGTAITGQMVGRLKVGMTPEQVRFVLGTPLLVDPFHADRWGYPYEYRAERSRTFERKLFAVFFKDGRLERWEGDIQPEPEREEGQNRVIEIQAAK